MTSTAVPTSPPTTSRHFTPSSGSSAVPGKSTSDVTKRGSAWSAEVQALRALAVLLVMLFHIWPDRVPGGYIGVDVFFVISGFLITGHIVRDLDGSRFGLGRFYVRRARRLLPASMLVLVVVSIAVVTLTPHTKWVSSAQQILASAGYVQNWVLAGSDVDYLSPATRPTAVQHFWSLSVEEQFYFVWPVLLFAAAWLTRSRRKRYRRLAVGGVMLVVTVVSFGYGLWATETNPAGAYFFSTTRMWEFSLGGLLALVFQSGVRAVGERHHVLAALLCWTGLGAIAASALVYTERTAFPGYAAALPVFGALAVIAAGPLQHSWSPAPFVKFGPTQLIGDMSYSLYLWHWPLIILMPLLLPDGQLGRIDKIGIFVLSLVLAWLSMTFVENRLRSAKPVPSAKAAAVLDAKTDETDALTPPRARRFARVRAWRPGPAFAMITASTVVVVIVAGGAWYRVDDQVTHAREVAAQAFAEETPCFGAASFGDPSCEPPFGEVVTPDAADATQDMRRMIAWQRCFSERTDDGMKTCTFGPADAKVNVVMFGDSHLLQWFNAIDKIAQDKGWRLTTYMRASCTPNSAFMARATAIEENRCQTWVTKAIRKIEADPAVDVVITSAFNNKRWKSEPGRDAYQAGVLGYRDTWARFVDGGRRQVVVLRDTPRPLASTISCVADATLGKGCGRARGPATTRADSWKDKPDPMLAAAAMSPGVSVIDLTDTFCTDKACPAVIGNVLVYADSNHMTPTFARSLAPKLENRLDSILSTRDPATAG